MSNDRKPNAVDRYIGERITEAREKAGMSQTALGEAMGGISYQMVQRYEMGEARIAAARLHLVAECFNRPHGHFFPQRAKP